MENARKNACVRYIFMRFMIATQRMNRNRTKHFPCCNPFILLVLKLTFTHELAKRELKYYLIILFRILDSNLPVNLDKLKTL